MNRTIIHDFLSGICRLSIMGSIDNFIKETTGCTTVRLDLRGAGA